MYRYFLLIYICFPYKVLAFNYDELKDLIKNRNIKTVEQLTENLPEELQRNITFKLKPHNRIQEGIRAIRFTSDGALVLTHNDSALNKGGNSIEIIAKDKDGNQSLHEITFAKDNVGLPQFSDDTHGKKSPTACTSCHGEPVRKIWPAYPVWADTCGEFEDRIDPKCQEFLTAAKFNPRFKDIKWSSDNLAWPYKVSGIDPERPNHSLSYLTEFDNARQFANHLKGNSVYKKLKYSLLSYAWCKPTQPQMARLQSLVTTYFLDWALPGNWGGTRAEYVTALFTTRPEYTSADVKSNIYYEAEKISLLGLMGIPYGNVGGNEHIEFNGITGIGISSIDINRSSLDYLLARILHDLSSVDEKIALALQKDSSYISFTYGENYPQISGVWKDAVVIRKWTVEHLCEHLTSQSEQELASLSERNTKPREDVALRDQLSEIELGKYLLDKHQCINCHDNSYKNVGPHIPFGNPEKFIAENSKREIWEDWISMSEFVMSDKIPRERRMPLNGRDLQEDEKRAILSYLKSL